MTSSRLDGPVPSSDERRHCLRRVNGERESIFDAIANQDADAARAAMRTHLADSRKRHRRADLLAAERPMPVGAVVG